MAQRWISLLLACGLVASATVASAQPPQGMSGSGPGPGGSPGPHRGGPPGPPGMGLVPDPRMLAQLGLSDAQRDRIDAVHDQHLHGTARPHADLRVAMLDLTRLLERDAPDAAAIAAQARRIGELQSALLQARITAALSIRKVLTPAQRAKLRRLQAERTDAGPPAAPGP